MGTDADRLAIYAIRHRVYATELGQHAENAEQLLYDGLDAFNQYIVVSEGERIVAFVSITPPGHGKYSVDKYVPPEALDVPSRDNLYEVRLLTVLSSHRSGPATPALMHAALRWIDDRGGKFIVAIGRRGVVGLYEKAGFQLAGRSIQSGRVTYELMTTDVERARLHAGRHEALIRRLAGSIAWRLPFSIFRELACEHGGAFFRAIGEDFSTLERRHAVISADVLDAWFPPAPTAVAAINEHLDWAMRTSPPTHCDGLVDVIAETRRVPRSSILPAGGSSAAIYLAWREWLKPDSKVLLLDPAYSEYRHVAEQVVGCRVERFHLRRETDYDVDVTQFAAAIERSRPDWVVVINPNNPTGRLISRIDLERLINDGPAGTRFWIDEAYLDYVGPTESLERFASVREGVFVCKSLSKAYALSGMRAAYLCGEAKAISALERISPPWSVGLPAQIAAVRALQSPEYYCARYRETHAHREALGQGLCALGVDVVPGCANFLLCHLPDELPDAATLIRECRRRNLFLRDVASMGGVGPRLFRIAVKDTPTNARTLDILEDVCRAYS